MDGIQMVDLSSQYLQHKQAIDQAIQQVLTDTDFIAGKAVKKLATSLADYQGSKHCIPCANGTDAIQIALMALGLREGDEVITTPFTFVATVEVIALLKLRPVFVDINPDTFNIDEEALEAAITTRTRCIIPVHLFGQACNMPRILEIARHHNLFVIEDNAQSFGAIHHLPTGAQPKVGTLADISTTSFYPTKNLGCYGDGGAIFTNDDNLATKLQLICNHGSRNKYYYETIGVNSRLDTIQAAILQVKLQHLDSFIHARQQAAQQYNQLLANQPHIKIPTQAPFSNHIYHQYTIQVPKRDQVKKQLADVQIPTMIYYPLSLHLQKAYAYLGYRQGNFPHAEAAANTVLSLPMHTELTTQAQQYIAQHLIQTLHNINPS